MKISFTKKELEVLWREICMLVDAAQECEDEGSPRADAAILQRIKDKVGDAYFAPKRSNKTTCTVEDLMRQVDEIKRITAQLEREQWRRKQYARIDAVMGWDKRREVQP